MIDRRSSAGFDLPGARARSRARAGLRGACIREGRRRTGCGRRGDDASNALGRRLAIRPVPSFSFCSCPLDGSAGPNLQRGSLPPFQQGPAFRASYLARPDDAPHRCRVLRGSGNVGPEQGCDSPRRVHPIGSAARQSLMDAPLARWSLLLRCRHRPRLRSAQPRDASRKRAFFRLAQHPTNSRFDSSLATWTS